MTHPSPDELESYIVDPSPSDTNRKLEAHVASCDACRGVVQREAALEVQLAELARGTACLECQRQGREAICGHCGAARRLPDYRLDAIKSRSERGRLYIGASDDGRPVAIKELVFARAPGLASVEAFEREAKFLQSLSHPEIPRFVASFQLGEGVHTRLYLVQELVDGESLLDRIAHHHFDEPELIDVARRVLAILAYLQSLSPPVFHRDVKPANLIRRGDGSIALVDFGAARDLGATVNATLVGTFGYMPVEQLTGIVDATTDLFGLGASLFHLATRVEPWQHDERIKARARLSRRLRSFVDRLTAPTTAHRFASASEALRALDRKPRPTRRRVVGTLAISLVAGGVGGMAVWKLALEPGEDTSPVVRPGVTDVFPSPEVPRTVPLPLRPRPSSEPPPIPKRDPQPPTSDCRFGILDSNPACRGGWLVYRQRDGRILDFRPGEPIDRAQHVPLPSSSVESGYSAVVVDPRGPRFYASSTRTDVPVIGELQIAGLSDDGEIKIEYRGVSGRPVNGDDDPTDGKANLFSIRGLAFDTRRHRLVVASGAMAVYAYAPDTDRWTLLSKNRDEIPYALAYSEREDVLYGLGNMIGGTALIRLSPDGELLDRRPIVDKIHPPQQYQHAFRQVGVLGKTLVMYKNDDDGQGQVCEILDLATATVLRDECSNATRIPAENRHP